MTGKDLVTLVGAGRQVYREYSAASLAERYRLTAVLGQEPTWLARYLTRYLVADLSDAAAVADAVRALSDGEQAAVFTWDETALEATALAAAAVGAPFLPPVGATRCRDKYEARQRFDAYGLPTVDHRLVATREELLKAAAEIGYPVVVKPRSLAGSIGVTAARTEPELLAAFESAGAASFPGLHNAGVVVEEYLDGPEISIDSVVCGSQVSCRFVARKELGFAPYFEEIGHSVTPWETEPWAASVIHLVTGAHFALGVTNAVTHAEVRLTAKGPRIVELNGRLGGDFIPLLGRLATGDDLVTAAAELALGRTPAPPRPVFRCSAVRFLYPRADCQVLGATVAEPGAVPGLIHSTALVEAGDRLRLPPRMLLPRWAALVGVGDSAVECQKVLDAAESLCRLETAPLD